MIKFGNFIVLIDACILYKAPIRDLLLRLAEAPAEMYQPKWTDQIVEEATRNLIEDERMDEEQAGNFKRCLFEAFEDAYIEGYEELIPVLKNQQKDRHILAAAIVAGAQVIVTDNIKDFPEEVLKQYNIESQTPDNFLLHLFDLAPAIIIATFKKQQQELTKPAISEEELLEKLKKSAPGFADKLKSILAELNKEADLLLKQEIEGFMESNIE